MPRGKRELHVFSPYVTHHSEERCDASFTALIGNEIAASLCFSQ
jgi:hypothetical protein